MIEGWSQRSIKEITERVIDNRGKTPPIQAEGIPLLEVNSISETNRNPNFDNVRKFVSQETYENWFRAGHPKAGDILLPTVGTIGNVSIMNDCISGIAQNLIALSIREDISSHYLYYFLSSALGKAMMLSLDIGGVQPSIKVPHLLDLVIPLPPLPEQKAIAEVLSSLDDKIDLLHRQNATLEALAETLFRQYFIEEAQDDWEEAKVSDLANHHKVTVKPQANPDTLYSHYSLPAFDDGREAHTEHGRDIRSGKYHVPDNSVLISKLNPEVSRVWLVGEQTHQANICSTEFQVAKPINPAHLPFVYCLFKSRMMRDELTASAGGTSKSHQRVKPADIFEFVFLRPPSQLIEVFAGQTMPMLEKLLENQEQIQTLEKLRDTLLPKLMSGAVRVQFERRDAEAEAA